jgi:hypothetical protein
MENVFQNISKSDTFVKEQALNDENDLELDNQA